MDWPVDSPTSMAAIAVPWAVSAAGALPEVKARCTIAACASAGWAGQVADDDRHDGPLKHGVQVCRPLPGVDASGGHAACLEARAVAVSSGALLPAFCSPELDAGSDALLPVRTVVWTVAEARLLRP